MLAETLNRDPFVRFTGPTALLPRWNLDRSPELFLGERRSRVPEGGDVQGCECPPFEPVSHADRMADESATGQPIRGGNPYSKGSSGP